MTAASDQTQAARTIAASAEIMPFRLSEPPPRRDPQPAPASAPTSPLSAVHNPFVTAWTSLAVHAFAHGFNLQQALLGTMSGNPLVRLMIQQQILASEAMLTLLRVPVSPTRMR